MPKPNNAPQVNIQRPCYAMASTDGQTADITMYGDIVEKQPIDRWTNEPIPGQYIVESEFLNDLAQIEGCSQITIRMDSLGGDAGVSILIHNRLRELAAKGTKLVCIVDGVAMSGGSLIMCACDTVRVNPSSLVMIHKCWSFVLGASSIVIHSARLEHSMRPAGYLTLGLMARPSRALPTLRTTMPRARPISSWKSTPRSRASQRRKNWLQRNSGSTTSMSVR